MSIRMLTFAVACSLLYSSFVFVIRVFRFLLFGSSSFMDFRTICFL